MDILRRLKIGQRLYLGFIAILLLFIALSFFTISKINHIYSLTTQLHEHPFTVTKAISDINFDILNIDIQLKNILTKEKSEKIKDYIKLIEKLKDDIYNNLDILSAQFLGNKELIIQIKGIIAKWNATHHEILTLIQSGQYLEAEKIKATKELTQRNILADNMQAVTSFAKGKANEFLLASEKTRTNALSQLYLLLSLFIVITITITVYIIRSFTLPIQTLHKAVNRFCSSSGSDIIEIEINGNDEIAHLSTSFNDLTHKLYNLIQELELTKKITKNISEGIVLVKASNGNIVYTNTVFDKMFGYNKGELIGKNIAVVNAPSIKTPEETAREIISILERDGVWKGDIVNIKKDGRVFLCHAAVSSFDHHTHGKVWVSVHSDITIERSNNFIHMVLNCIEEGIVSINKNGIFTYFNKAALNILKVPPDAKIDEIMKFKYYTVCFPDKYGQPSDQLLKNEDRTIFHALSGRDVSNNESIVKFQDGSFKSISSNVRQLKDNQGNSLGAVISIHDISLQKRAENDLRKLSDELEQKVRERTKELLDINNQLNVEIQRRMESEFLFKKQFEHGNIGIAITSPDKGWLKVNQKIYDMLGYTQEELYKMTWPELTHKEDLEADIKEFERVIKGEINDYELDKRLIHKNGGIIYIHLTVSGYRKPDGNIDFFIATLQDITERKLLEEKISIERDKLFSIMNAIDSGIYIVNKDYDIEYINPVIERDFGAVNQRKCYEYFHDRSESCPWCKNDEVFSGKSVYWQWYSFKTDKTYKLFDTPIINIDGSLSKFEIFYDITDLINTQNILVKEQERIKSSLREKELLLGEIHHRVKNNMAVVNAIISMQGNSITDESQIALFREIEMRIKSMAIIHEKLYRSKDFSNVDFKEYISSLSDSLFNTYKTLSDNIHLNIDVKDVSLGIDMAVPCGLLINELLSNTLKHAFPEGKGDIYIGMNRVLNESETLSENEIELIVRDNGIGLSKGFDINNTETLGWQLIIGLIESQLKGKITINNVNGLEIKIRFSERNKEMLYFGPLGGDKTTQGINEVVI